MSAVNSPGTGHKFDLDRGVEVDRASDMEVNVVERSLHEFATATRHPGEPRSTRKLNRAR